MTVIRTVLRLKCVMVFVLLLGITQISLAVQKDQTPSKELVQYIHEAKRRGVAEAKIKQQAVAIGWSETAVDEAFAYERSGKPLPVNATPPAVAAAQPQTLVRVSETATVADSATPPTAPAKTAAIPAGIPKMAPVVSDDYLIGSGDTLQISVWAEPAASVPSVVVRPDGKITVPLVKEVEVAGLTPRQAEAVITERIGKFITDANVAVVVVAINSKKIYLIGGVKKEGPLLYTYGITVMQALSEAGGLTDYAKSRKIYILRTENGREYRLDFNYEEVIRGERMEQNVVLLPGDTVVIPQ